MSKTDLTHLDLISVADAIAKGELSAFEVTEACLARIDQFAQELNCFVTVERGEALELAEQADKNQKAGGVLGPLHGVPLAHKDVFYRQGKIMTAGSKIFADFRAPYTATAVDRLAQAGAVHLGAVHAAEIALSPTGFNKFLGPARNPWNLDHVTGGSSSGSGAAVAARLIYGSLGTDTGGSIRHPAAMCGLTGLKPSTGRASRYGVFPLAQSLDCIGPLARSARDCARLLHVIAGSDRNDPSADPRAVPAYEELLDGDVRGLRIGLPRSYYYDEADTQVTTLVQESLKALEGRGATLVPVDVPDMARVNDLARIVFTFEAFKVHERWLSERPQDYAEQVRRRVEPGKDIADETYEAALRVRAAVVDEFVQTSLNSVDVLHIPTVPLAAPRIDYEYDAPMDDLLSQISRVTRNNRGINYLGLPAISVPCGFTGEGLPVGFELVGRSFDEATLLRAAHAYQQDTHWHTKLPPLALASALQV